MEREHVLFGPVGRIQVTVLMHKNDIAPFFCEGILQVMKINN
jgi:hypothetical protein